MRARRIATAALALVLGATMLTLAASAPEAAAARRADGAHVGLPHDGRRHPARLHGGASRPSRPRARRCSSTAATTPVATPDASYIQRFVASKGHYAYIGVNLRGTGCSTGTFDFFQPQEAVDGAAVVQWIRQQPWSSGLVGMIGKSYPGITQLFVAAQHPEGLAAIAPGHFFADAYRDVARPGGIANHGFGALWSFVGRPSYEFQDGPVQVLGGDAGCLRGTTGEITGLPTNPYVQLLQHPYDDASSTSARPSGSSPSSTSRCWPPSPGRTSSWPAARPTSSPSSTTSASRAGGPRSPTATTAWPAPPPRLDDLERFYDHFLRGQRQRLGDAPACAGVVGGGS